MKSALTSQDYRKFHQLASSELVELEKWKVTLNNQHAPISIQNYVELQIEVLKDDLQRYEGHFQS